MFQAKKKLREDNRIDNWCYLWMGFFMVVGFCLFSVIHYFFGDFVLKISAAVIIVLLVGGLLYSAWKKTGSERRTVYVFLFISIILRACYVILTADTPLSGQEYEIFRNVQSDITLPDAHQPLYYIVSALIYNSVSLLSFAEPYNMDILRLVSEYMGIVSAIAVYYILCELESNDTAIYLGTAIIAFHPGLIRLGGEISPLMPMFAVLCLTMMFLTRWNNFTDGFDFIFMSISFGIAVMLDMSALVILPVVAVLVVINLVRVIGRKNGFNTFSCLLQTLGGTAAWAVLSFVYPVRNMLMGKETGIMQLFGNYSGTLDFNTKFLSFAPGELMEIFISPKDKNAWVYLVKSSIYGNLTEKDVTIDLVYPLVFILISFAVASIAGLTIFGNMIARADAKKKGNIWTVIAMCGCVVAYYILQNIGSNDASTMDFRVIPFILALGVTMLCCGIKVLSVKKKLSFVSNILYVLTVFICLVFCIGCVAYGCWFIQ